MYQQSVDRSGGSQKSDLILFIVLIIAFFAVGAVVMYLEKLFDSNVPRYVFIGLVLAAIYAIYRLRIIGFRYTVFYKEPETVYDPRFDDMITHEDYPYPVGTIVFERIVSAKGTTIETLCGGDIVAVCAPGGEYSGENASSIINSANVSCKKAEKAYSVVYKKGDALHRIFFNPDEEFLNHVREIAPQAEFC